MISFKINKCVLENEDCYNPKRMYKLDNLFENLEEKLNKVKTRQDSYFENKDFLKQKFAFDIFRKMKYKLAKHTNAQNISNAWLKIYELINQFNLIDENKKKLVHFDNAAFPGSFILGTNHYVKTMTKVNSYRWYGSSWIGYNNKNLKTGDLLEDKYNLYKNYPKFWLMNKKYDGNVNDIENQLYWKKQLNNSVDLYTSDLGFETGDNNDYSKQEYSHVQPNVGQTLSGILTLKQGGHLVVKQYTYFNSLNISLYAVLTNLFEEVYICKPITSRPPNSETYVVCKGFLGPFNSDEEGYKLVKLIENKIKNFDMKPLIYKRCLSEDFLDAIVKSLTFFVERQITYINKRLDWYDSIKKLPYRFKQKRGEEKLKDWKKKIIITWSKENPVYKLKNYEKIRNIKENITKKSKKKRKYN
jgi:hypothetical protein